MPPLHIQLLGEFRLVYDDMPVTDFHSPRLQSLLAYLILHRTAPQLRRQLAFLFWPESSESQAHSNLRKLFHQLRQVLPEPNSFLHYDHLTIQWQANAPVTIDIDILDQHLTAIAQMPFDLNLLTRIVELYTGPLLPDCYDDWIMPLRQKYQRAVEQILKKLVTTLANQHAYAEGARYAQRLLDLEPLEETGYQHLMRLRNLRGDRAGALRVYYDCVRVLKRELGVEPSAATQKIYEQIVNSTQSIPALGQTLPTRTDTQTRLAATVPLVGRGEAWQQVQIAWQKASQGVPHLLVIAGEAGIGKTRLAEELLMWANQQGVRTARTRSYAAQGELAYAPISELLRSPTLHPYLNNLSDLWRTEVARLLPELLTECPTLTPPGPLAESWQRQRFFEALARAFLIDEQPLLLLLDDLQWCNEETLRCLHFLLHFAPETPLLIVGTLRIEEVAQDHPIHALQLELQCNEQWAEVNLLPLTQEDVTNLARQMSGATITAAEAEQLYRITEGNPLFVVETIRADTWRTTAMKTIVSNHHPLSLDPAQTLPPKVYAIVRTRLNQLSTAAQELVSIAATIGRAFTFEQLAAVSKQEEGKLINSLDELWQRRILREQGVNSYDFSHDRIREVAYSTISRTRQRLLHQQVAQAFETIYANRLQEVSGQLATHWAQAERLEKAMNYYQQAAEAARQIHANSVAVGYYRQAIILLEQLPTADEHAQYKLQLLIGLGSAMRDIKGFALSELGSIYTQALELSQQIGAGPEILPVLHGLAEFYRVRAEYANALAIGEQMIALAEQLQATHYLVIANFQLGVSWFTRGELGNAYTYLERSMAFSIARQSYPRVYTRFAHVLWMLGYPQRALALVQEIRRLPQELLRPSDVVDLLGEGLELRLLCNELSYIEQDQDIEAMLALIRQYDMEQQVSWATYLRGWSRALQNQCEGVEEMEQGLNKNLSMGGLTRRTRFFGWLAEMSMHVHQPQKTAAYLDEANVCMQRTNERFWEAELYRLKGEWLLIQHEDQQILAETWFQRALATARQQRVKSLELRAAISLSRLWQNHGKLADAQALLAEVYGWFTEGFETEDLQTAQRLLATGA
ncbi:MAG: AAA family ATPase [Caldilineaceae bacterium]|nr:AAA family ATPase [Caldilineaceae bacterium]